MGLDSYGLVVNPALEGTDTDPRGPFVAITGLVGRQDGEEVVSKRVAYWRKHYRLHQWMEELYRQKGGESEFNCVRVYLDSADLVALEHAIPSFDESYRRTDEDFLNQARIAISNGLCVCYTSWW